MKRWLASYSLAALAAACAQGGTTDAPDDFAASSAAALDDDRCGAVDEAALCRLVDDAFAFADQRLHETVAFLKAT